MRRNNRCRKGNGVVEGDAYSSWQKTLIYASKNIHNALSSCSKFIPNPYYPYVQRPIPNQYYMYILAGEE